MSEFLSNLLELWKERLTNPLYVTYVSFFLILHWKQIYILFFDGGVFHGLERLFVADLVSFRPTNVFAHYIFDPIALQGVNILAQLLYSFVFPLILSLIAIRYFPFITIWAQQWNDYFYFERKMIRVRAQNEYEGKKLQLLSEREKIVSRKQNIEEKLEQAKTEKEKFLDIYSDFISNSLKIRAFQEALVVYYKYSGRYTTHPEKREVDLPLISANNISIVDSAGLFNAHAGPSGAGSGILAITDPGKKLAEYLQTIGKIKI